MIRKSLLSILSIAIIGSATAQVPDILPKGFYEGEEQYMDQYLQDLYNNYNRAITTPPGLPARTAAQWEEVQALVITWTGYPSILAQIADAAQEECTVIIHCTDSVVVKNDLTGYGV